MPLGIHGRGNDFFAFARHHRSGQHIIGYPIGQLSDDIGRRRGNQHHVRAFRQRTGKMGYALAKHCAQRGAEVTLITGKTQLEPPLFVRVIEVESAGEMFEAVKERYEEQDIIMKAAAVADYRPLSVSEEKVKKTEGEMSIALERTEDILKFLGENRRKGQFLCGFSMETENMLENSRAKLEKKHADMIVANNLKQEGAGFGTDTNIVTLITRDGCRELPVMSKEDVAKHIIDTIQNHLLSDDPLL